MNFASRLGFIVKFVVSTAISYFGIIPLLKSFFERSIPAFVITWLIIFAASIGKQTRPFAAGLLLASLSKFSFEYMLAANMVLRFPKTVFYSDPALLTALLVVIAFSFVASLYFKKYFLALWIVPTAALFLYHLIFANSYYDWIDVHFHKVAMDPAVDFLFTTRKYQIDSKPRLRINGAHLRQIQVHPPSGTLIANYGSTKSFSKMPLFLVLDPNNSWSYKEIGTGDSRSVQFSKDFSKMYIVDWEHDTVSCYDTENWTQIAVASTKDEPHSICLDNKRGFVYVMTEEGCSIEQFDQITLKKRLAVDLREAFKYRQLQGIQLLFLEQYDRLYGLVMQQGGYLFILNPESLGVERHMRVGSWTDIAYDAGHNLLYGIDYMNGTFYALEPSALELKFSVKTGHGNYYITPDNERELVYVSGPYPGNLFVIDSTSQKLLGKIFLGKGLRKVFFDLHGVPCVNSQYGLMRLNSCYLQNLRVDRSRQ